MMLVQHGRFHMQASWGGSRGPVRETQRGNVWFVGAGTALEFEAVEDTVVWLATCRGLGYAPLSPSEGGAEPLASNAVPFSPPVAAALQQEC